MEDAEVPAGWSMAKLGDLGQWTSGGTPSKKRPDYHNGHIPWVLTGDLDDGPVKDVPNKITEAGLKNSSAKVFPTGTLLMAMYGATIGKLGILHREAATNQACAALLPSNGNREALPYVYFYLLSQRENFKKAGKGGAQPNISQGVIKDTAIPVAPLPEQQRIVEKIETLFAELDKGEEALRAVQKLLARYRQSVLKAAVTGTLTADWRAANPPTETGKELLARILKARRKSWQGRGRYREPVEPDTDGLPELPEGWAWTCIEALCPPQKTAIKAGPFGSSLRKSEYSTSGFKIYGQEQVIADDPSIGEYYINEIKFRELKNCEVKPNDILISLVGTVGRVLILPNDCAPGIINPRLMKISTDPTIYKPEFFKAYFTSAFLKALYSTETHGATMDVLNLGIIKRLPFPVCPIYEQKEICSRVNEAFAKIELTEKWCKIELKRSAALRQSILKDAFSGKLVPQDPSEEPAAKLLERIRAARSDKPRATHTRASA